MCTPNQIMSYQTAIKLYKVVENMEESLNLDPAITLDKIVCSRRQIIPLKFKKIITTKLA